MPFALVPVAPLSRASRKVSTDFGIMAAIVEEGLGGLEGRVRAQRGLAACVLVGLGLTPRWAALVGINTRPQQIPAERAAAVQSSHRHLRKGSPVLQGC